MTEFSRPIRTRAARLQRTALRLAILLTALLVSASAAQPAAAIDRDGIANALLATVQIIMPDNDYEIFSLGSGTVMNDSGLILTNYHVVEGDRPNGLRNDDGRAAIAVAPADLRGESVLKFFGEVVKTHPELDLALIQIVAPIDNPQAQLPSNLGLTPITLGNSDDLIISDEINMFGYPDIGSNTPTYTKGIVAGFLDEDRNGIYEWIKTDASLAHGNSGGLATDANGHFVGVPTLVAGDDAGSLGLLREHRHVVGMIHRHSELAPFGQARQPLYLEHSHDLVGDQDVRDAGIHHHLGLAHLGAGDAVSAGCQQHLGDLRALVGLDVGA